MSIEPLFNFEVKIENKKLLYIIESRGIEFTELRMIHFIKELDKFLETLLNEKIKKVYFIFNMTKYTIPKNLTLLRELSDVFSKYTNIFIEKLEFSIIEVDNNIFRMFLSLFKQYYTPRKPLYICKNQEETQDCLNDPKKREILHEVNSNDL